MNKMNKQSIVRILEIDAGHRLHNHEGKCKDLHGHRYKFELHIEAYELDDVGRVVDFGLVKTIVGNWLDQNWDHGMILNKDDPIARLWTGDYEDDEVAVPTPCREGMKYFLLPCNPTAENLSAYLMDVANDLLWTQNISLKVTKVVCWETPNCMAIAEIG